MPGLFYKRNLPHWQPDGRTLFVTWRLHGSLPKNLHPLRDKQKPFTGREFRRVDAVLDAAATGPVWLKEARIAACVADAIHLGAGKLGRYELHAWVVMANHVHILMHPFAPMPEIMKGIKGFTARQANRLLGRKGSFWQDESFDHWVRSEAEFWRIQSYIERNPVLAGLARKPQDWPWSSAAANKRAQAG